MKRLEAGWQIQVIMRLRAWGRTAICQLVVIWLQDSKEDQKRLHEKKLQSDKPIDANEKKERLTGFLTWPNDRTIDWLTSHRLNTPESTFKESKIYPHTLSFSTWNMGGWELFFFTLTPDERRTKKWHVKPLKVPSNNMIGFWFKHIMSDNVFKQRAESKLFSKCQRESREPG